MKSNFSIIVMLVLVFAFSSNAQAQRADAVSTANATPEPFTRQAEPQVSNIDLIKFATKAPNSNQFSSETEYMEAKNLWVAENREAYKKIVSKLE